MKRSDYRAAFDAIPFREDFRRETVRKLRQSTGQPSEKEFFNMKKKRFVLLAAALSSLLVVSAAAAAVMLRPGDVARHAGQDALAAAFEGGEAVTVNETRTVGDYEVTFMGLVSGEGLSQTEYVSDEVQRDKSYAVLAYARTDGAAIEEDVPDLTVSPLVEGYAPWRVNAWTLNGGTCTFAVDGTLYYLFECDNVEPFADRTVYLAVYPGSYMPPDSGTFAFDENTGAISVKADMDVALFTLPLDESKADPQKAQAILDGMFWAQADPDDATDVDDDPEVDQGDAFLLLPAVND